MPDDANRRPRGLNFLLGGVLAAGVLLSGLVLTGAVDFGGFGAPTVRIDDPHVVLSGRGSASQLLY